MTVHEKPTANIILNSERLNGFLLILETGLVENLEQLELLDTTGGNVKLYSYLGTQFDNVYKTKFIYHVTQISHS